MSRRGFVISNIFLSVAVIAMLITGAIAIFAHSPLPFYATLGITGGAIFLALMCKVSADVIGSVREDY